MRQLKSKTPAEMKPFSKLCNQMRPQKELLPVLGGHRMEQTPVSLQLSSDSITPTSITPLRLHRPRLPTGSIFVSVDKGIFNYCNYHLKIGFLPQTIEIRFCYFLSLLMSFNMRFHFLSAIKYVYACMHALSLSRCRDPCTPKIYVNLLHMLERFYSQKGLL